MPILAPADTPVTRAILRADAELKQVAPNLTFIYDAEITPDDLLLEVAKTFVNAVSHTFPMAL